MAFERGRLSRRTLGCISAGILAAWPCLAIVQVPNVVRRIGVLDNGSPDIPQEVRQAKALREFGWVEGQNLHVARRYDNGRSQALPALAEELARAKVEVIVTLGTAATLAAKRATAKIPIVFSVGDPVLLGLVPSLARPGGNLTGISQVSPEITAKYLSVLKELLPRLQRIGVLWEAGHPYWRASRGQFEHVCRSLGLTPIIVEVSTAAEIAGAIAQLERQQAQALVVGVGSFTWDHRLEIVDAATKQRLPTIFSDDPLFVREAGALIAYTRSQVEDDRLLAEYIDRILRGAKPADLPVRQPTKFELVINLKTAKALGITVPQSLLVRADEVIQ